MDAVPNLSGPGPISGGPLGGRRGYGRVVSDGKHVAWIDRAANEVKVRDLDTAAVTSHLSGLPADLESGFSLAGLQDGTLVAHYTKVQFPEAGPAFSINHYALVDLATGTRREIADVALYGDFALGDGRFAFFTSPAGGGPHSWEVIDRLEVMNLATGVRTTVEEGLNVRGFSGHIFISNNLLVWEGQPVRTFNLVTGERQTPIDTLADPGEGASLLGFNGQHLLVRKSPDTGFAGFFMRPEWPVRLELVDWEGRADTIASDTATPSTLTFWDARLVGSYVVWIDDNPDEIVIYDTRNRNKRRVPAIPE